MSSMTPGKAANVGKVLASYVSGLDLRIDPVQIDIEPTTRCNLKCRMCPNPGLPREHGFMDPALFRRIVDQSIDHTVEYHIDLHGEPLLHRSLVEMLSYAVDKGGRVALYTNLALRNDPLIRSLALTNVDRLIVNLSATDAESYRVIHGKDSIDTVKRNLTLIRAVRDRNGTVRPRLVVSFLEMEGNRHQTPLAAQLLEPLCDEVLIRPIHDWLGTPEITPLVPEDRPRPLKMKCSRPWTSASILWDGRVAACCYDSAGRKILGDLRRSSLHEIWNSASIRDFRRRYRRTEPCCDCFDEDHQFSPANLLFLVREAFRGRE